MALFQIHNKKVQKLFLKHLKEKSIQEIIEKNLDIILNVDFLANEYVTTWGGRIDTLGIDRNGSPVIIEYKKSQNDNVINQGLSYLRWLLDHKAEFENLCKERNIKIAIDWESPRVICIAESYNRFDLDTADLLPIKIELYKYSIYSNDILLLEPEIPQKIKISSTSLSKDKRKQKKFVKTFTIEEHLNRANSNTRKIFLSLRERIKSLDENVIEEPKAKYIAYKFSTNFVDIVVLANSLKIFLNVKSGQLNDPYNIARDLTKPHPIGHWGNGDYEIKLSKEEDIEKVFELIKQSYSLNK